MIVQEKGEMIGNEIFAADTEVKRVKVLKLSPHTLQSLFWNTRLGGKVLRQLSAAEDVIPDFVNHLFRGNVGLASAWLLATRPSEAQ